jgi:hypothetical protein
LDRRKFIKNSSLGATLPFWLSACDLQPKAQYPIHVRSDHHIGHLIRESQNWPIKSKLSTETVIVGGGLAGLSAAYGLGQKDYLLLELSDRLGGTSGANSTNGFVFAQGAHYDLEYPAYYGTEVLQMLESLRIIHYQSWKKSWSFNDDEHLIPSHRSQQCLVNGVLRVEVIPEGTSKNHFYAVIAPFVGKMPLPTRLIASDLRYLNDITFKSFLDQNNVDSSSRFRSFINYHLLDDYGGESNQVSALAGIHYFACRPYFQQHVAFFSPPEGNYYFADKIIQKLDQSRLMNSHLVANIEKYGERYILNVLDIVNQQVIKIESESVIYAGSKHTLPFVFPSLQNPFSTNQYAPWMIINLVDKQRPNTFGYWQNEHLDNDSGFLGFMNSSIQFQESVKGNRVLTGYYCLKPEDHEYLLTIEANKQRIVDDTLTLVNSMLPKKVNPTAAYINVLGHAMPIPALGYLFSEPAKSLPTGFACAGVDTGRLPLLFEALDSGLISSNA